MPHSRITYAPVGHEPITPPYGDNWDLNPSGDECPWCHGHSDFDPFDADDAGMILCRGHLAEYMGTSLDGLDKAERDAYADMSALGYFD